MALIHKKQKPSAPVLSKDALLQIKHEALQESEKKLASLGESQAALLLQKASLQADHHNALIAHGLEQNQESRRRRTATPCESYESQIVQVQRKIAAIDAARGYQQAIHAEITRELSALQEEISRQKYREYITELECRVKARKEELIAHLYAGCGLLSDPREARGRSLRGRRSRNLIRRRIDEQRRAAFCAGSAGRPEPAYHAHHHD